MPFLTYARLFARQGKSEILTTVRKDKLENFVIRKDKALRILVQEKEGKTKNYAIPDFNFLIRSMLGRVGFSLE